jgi:hypothetical protein
MSINDFYTKYINDSSGTELGPNLTMMEKYGLNKKFNNLEKEAR